MKPTTENQVSITTIEQLQGLLERVRQKQLSDTDWLIVDKLILLVINLSTLLSKKRIKVKQIREWFFGSVKDKRETEKTKDGKQSEAQAAEVEAKPEKEKKPRAPGHGRNSADAYTGADLVHCAHEELKLGSSCPDKLCKGHLQDYYRDASFIRLDGQPPIGATRYIQETLRCSDCLRCYTAKLPPAIAPEKYAPSADAVIVLYKYGFFIPFNRLAQLQRMFGIPLPASVQWQRAEFVANCLLPIFLYLQLIAAQGETLYHDDTKVKILRPLPPKSEKRTGLFTTGIVVEYEEWEIALYSSGRNHAGENAAQLLEKRPKELPDIRKMSDASAMNNCPKVPAIILLCLAHARGKFKKIEEIFTQACKYVIEVIGSVYDFEEQTKVEQMTKQQRLEYHQKKSLPLMENLREWMKEQFEKKEVEPNSALGSAFNYFLDHFYELTQFTRIIGAPLDNNICERILRLAALHRKNSLFYRNDTSAFIGDILMSVIQSCRLNKVDPYQYLITIIEHSRAARASPENWLPWNYQLNEQKEQKTVAASPLSAGAPGVSPRGGSSQPRR